jgi:sulfoxide reductase catalytic subunit YedY
MAKPFRSDVHGSDVTPPEIFFNRREFVTGLGAAMAMPSMLLGAEPSDKLRPPFERPDVFPTTRNGAFSIPEGIVSTLTEREVAATHNNFYEFLPGRGGPAWEAAGAFEPSPWKIEISGECAKPQTLDLDDLFAFAHEERIYHFRCVERWAMNVPWSGFPLADLIKKAEPTSKAKFVRFESANRPEQMPGIEASSWYPWPYHEGLRIDEAMNQLAMVVTGVYGEPLLKQHGSPVRIIVPWKYGYKNPKSIVKIEFLRKQPKTFWQVQPHEYGFLSNINPNIPHPRWSQERSYWLHNEEFFPTQIFNGYEQYVADLYPDEPRTPQKPLVEGEIAR